jgi:hypothetical protein
MAVATGKGVYIGRQVELLGMPAQVITIFVALKIVQSYTYYTV